MISLTKSEKPPVLVEKAQEWTRDILEKIAGGMKVGDAVGARYNHPDIKKRLLEETFDKCAYCESKITHIAYGDIEHITAKKVDPSLAVDWDNLTIACDKCNQKKSDNDGVIDPYSDDPGEHLLFLGPILRARPTSGIGQLTERLLDLNRVPLVERRLDKIDYALSFLRHAASVKDERLKSLIEQDALSLCDSCQEYSAAVSQAVNALYRR